MKSFSIITPIYAYNQQKADELLRAINSVKEQSYDHRYVEHIIVNDGSPHAVAIPHYSWIRVINQSNLQRITAYNAGLAKARKDLICFLDGDDEYAPDYLQKVNMHFEENPDYALINFGCKYVHKDGNITSRGPFTPQPLEKGHEVFGGGNIVNGTFVFKRSVYADLGGFPPAEIDDVDCSELNYGGIRKLEMVSPYDFAAAAQVEFPEIRQYFMVDHENEPNKIIKELGNPFGQDFYLFYKYTRKYHSKPFDDELYVVHVR